MNGSRPKPAEALLAEQHLGDRLSALVDGELGHDSRERVLAHLATCAKCKVEADAQRRLKNVFAAAAPPMLSDSFLARLQGLPASGDEARGGGVFGAGPDRFEFGYVPVGPHAADSAGRGFPVHPVGRTDAERSASRGLRFAAAAAGAVSLAAVALGGVTTGMPGGVTPDARGGSGGSNVTPARTPGGSGGTGAVVTDTQRGRRSTGSLLVQGIQAETPSTHQLTTPVVTGAAVMSPLIRPLGATPSSPRNTAP